MIADALLSASPVIEAEDAAALNSVRESAVHLAVWRRPLPAPLAGLADLDWRAIDDVDSAVLVATLGAALPLLLETAGYPDIRAALAGEIVALARRFADLTAADTLRIRLEVIETDACRRFHADYVTFRLLMPLVGPGTQWTHRGSDQPTGTLCPGDVGIFKGRLLTDEPTILHRSPPLGDSGQKRLLLAIDPINEADL